MSFNYITRLITIVIICLFFFGCNSILNSPFEKDKPLKNVNSDINVINENNDKIDLLSYKILENNTIDYYTYENVKIDFFNKELKNLKINSFEGKIKDNLPLNVIVLDSSIYSINSEGNILEFDIETGKLIQKHIIETPILNKTPVSFSQIKDDFIVGFKSGEIVRVSKTAELIWVFKKDGILNTPIKHLDNNLIILYSEDLIILSSIDADLIFEKKFKSGNIIQSNGGKIVNYFNLIFFILPNSEFEIIDNFLYSDYLSDLDKLQISTPLNNLNDTIHIYKNLFVYLDNLDTLNTYDLINDEFLIKNLKINNVDSSILFNNALITKNDINIKFYNLENGYLFNSINIEKIIKKDTELIQALSINNNLHIFLNNGTILIFNEELKIKNIINLKIKKINKVYSYQDKIFISTEKGTTNIF